MSKEDTHLRNFRRALVLGGTGFIGSALVRHLLNKGMAITCLTHRTKPEWNSPQIRIIRGSITNFRWDALNSSMPDVIFHLARIAGRGRLHRLISARRGAAANHRLIKWLKGLQNPPLLVYVTGTLCYGSRGEEHITEESCLSPTSYAREYAAQDGPILDALFKKELPVMVMRPAWVYGEGSWFDRFYASQIKKYGHVPVYGDGENWMSFIHVDDCAGMISFIAENAEHGETYNLFSEPAIMQKDFVSLMSDVRGSIPIKSVLFDEVREKHGRAAEEAFGFSLRVGTNHEKLYQKYNFLYSDLREGLSELLTRF